MSVRESFLKDSVLQKCIPGFVKIIWNCDRPLEDGSDLKEVADLKHYIKAVFTKKALNEYFQYYEDSFNSPPDLRQALLLLNIFRVEFLPASDSKNLEKRPQFVLVVEKFGLCDIHKGFDLKHEPKDLMAEPEVQAKLREMENNYLQVKAQEQENNQPSSNAAVNSQESVSLSQLLAAMGEASMAHDRAAQSQAQEDRPEDKEVSGPSQAGRPAVFTKQEALAKMCQLNYNDFVVSADQQAKLDAIPEWKDDYVPPVPETQEEGQPTPGPSASADALFEGATLQVEASQRHHQPPPLPSQHPAEEDPQEAQLRQTEGTPEVAVTTTGVRKQPDANLVPDPQRIMAGKASSYIRGGSELLNSKETVSENDPAVYSSVKEPSASSGTVHEEIRETRSTNNTRQNQQSRASSLTDDSTSGSAGKPTKSTSCARGSRGNVVETVASGDGNGNGEDEQLSNRQSRGSLVEPGVKGCGEADGDEGELAHRQSRGDVEETGVSGPDNADGDAGEGHGQHANPQSPGSPGVTPAQPVNTGPSHTSLCLESSGECSTVNQPNLSFSDCSVRSEDSSLDPFVSQSACTVALQAKPPLGGRTDNSISSTCHQAQQSEANAAIPTPRDDQWANSSMVDFSDSVGKARPDRDRGNYIKARQGERGVSGSVKVAPHVTANGDANALSRGKHSSANASPVSHPGDERNELSFESETCHSPTFSALESQGFVPTNKNTTFSALESQSFVPTNENTTCSTLESQGFVPSNKNTQDLVPCDTFPAEYTQNRVTSETAQASQSKTDNAHNYRVTCRIAQALQSNTPPNALAEAILLDADSSFEYSNVAGRVSQNDGDKTRHKNHHEESSGSTVEHSEGDGRNEDVSEMSPTAAGAQSTNVFSRKHKTPIPNKERQLKLAEDSEEHHSSLSDSSQSPSILSQAPREHSSYRKNIVSPPGTRESQRPNLAKRKYKKSYSGPGNSSSKQQSTSPQYPPIKIPRQSDLAPQKSREGLNTSTVLVGCSSDSDDDLDMQLKRKVAPHHQAARGQGDFHLGSSEETSVVPDSNQEKDPTGDDVEQSETEASKECGMQIVLPGSKRALPKRSSSRRVHTQKWQRQKGCSGDQSDFFSKGRHVPSECDVSPAKSSRSDSTKRRNAVSDENIASPAKSFRADYSTKGRHAPSENVVCPEKSLRSDLSIRGRHATSYQNDVSPAKSSGLSASAKHHSRRHTAAIVSTDTSYRQSASAKHHSRGASPAIESTDSLSEEEKEALRLGSVRISKKRLTGSRHSPASLAKKRTSSKHHSHLTSSGSKSEHPTRSTRAHSLRDSRQTDHGDGASNSMDDDIDQRLKSYIGAWLEYQARLETPQQRRLRRLKLTEDLLQKVEESLGKP